MAIASSILPIHTEALLPPLVAAPIRAANSQVRSAVDTLNQFQTAGAGREFSISIDSKTKQPVVRIVDSATRELLEQIPSQSILDLAQELSAHLASNNTDLGR